MQKTLSAPFGAVMFNTSIYDKTVSDAGSGSDSLNIAVELSVLSDSGAGADSGDQDKEIVLTDSKQASRHFGMFGARQMNASLLYSGGRIGFDSISIAEAPILLPDLGVGADAIAVAVSFVLADNGTGSDHDARSRLRVRVWVTDTCSRLNREKITKGRVHP